MKKVSGLILMGCILACQQSVKRQGQTEAVTIDTIMAKPATTGNWYDTLVMYYISKSDKALIKSERKFKDKLDWELDSTEKRDSANYYIFKIGHHEADEDGSNMRFTAAGWIYIDSISKKIYEYDLPNDTIIEWKK